ncbi:hypothetical protein L3X38_043683 [Prunus dulcis]|uniref:Pentatricopeptide repeat-containing protein n=1 Tax=Prunus dulcis TaxID=3755 RepID=A0AAD4UZA1_PRUDU|nr:hypothetical protein L3X38_043683 [Prunus dulcis]
MEDAIRILQVMTGKGLSPDVPSYSTIITGFCWHQELESAFRMKLEMMDKGVSLDAVTYSSLIQGESCDLFQEMLSMGMPPDEFTYTTLINAYCVEGDLNKSPHLNDEMIQK